jgi:hypothetical protein
VQHAALHLERLERAALLRGRESLREHQAAHEMSDVSATGFYSKAIGINKTQSETLRSIQPL